METSGKLLKRIIREVRPELEKIGAAERSRKPDRRTWSKKEILGHLIDSASNNHQRFVRANFRDDLLFDGYEQEGWVSVQDYQQADWADLTTLWYQFNLHLAEFIDKIPEEVKHQKRLEHNLDRIAWKTVPKNEVTTLDYFIKDYIGHLEHHLRQILPEYLPKMIGHY